MSRQGVNTVQKGCCSGCEKPIVGQVITALGKTWHPEHFTCNHCSQELGTRNFFERDGFPYCEPDYHNLFSPRCAYCNGAILDVMKNKKKLSSSQIYINLIFYRNVLLHWTRLGTLNISSVLNVGNNLEKMDFMNVMENHIAGMTILKCLHLNAMVVIVLLWKIIYLH